MRDERARLTPILSPRLGTHSEWFADDGRMVPSLLSIGGSEKVDGEGYRSRVGLESATQHILPPPWPEDAQLPNGGQGVGLLTPVLNDTRRQ